jgi:hypothetical protein
MVQSSANFGHKSARKWSSDENFLYQVAGMLASSRGLWEFIIILTITRNLMHGKV